MDIKITLALHSDLTESARQTGIDRSSLAVRSIEIAYKLESALKTGQEIYHLDKLVPIPLPKRGGPTIHTIHVPTSLESFRALNEVKKFFDIEYHDVLSWGLNRMPDIVDRLMYGEIYIVGPAGPNQLTLSWIHSKQRF